MRSLAPAFLDVELQVQRRLAGEPTNPEALRAVFVRARSFLEGSDGLFRQVKETLLTDDLGEQKLQLAEQERQQTRHCLDRLEDACASCHPMVLADRLKLFQGSAHRCLELFSEFAAQAAQQPIYSPSPPFDAFIKASIKHLEGRLDRAALEARFDDLGRELGRWQRLLGLLPRLHQSDPALLDTLEKSLAGLQTGFGAVAQWRREDDKVALQDGLSLMGSSTTLLEQKMAELEQQIAARPPRFSSFRPLEEWLRLRRVCQDPPPIKAAWIEATVLDLFRAWDYLLARGDELSRHPLAGEGLSPAVMADHHRVRQAWHQELLAAPPADWARVPEQRWLDLRPSLEGLQKEVLAAHRRAEEGLSPFQELPGLEALATLKERVKRGEGDGALLKAELERQLAQVEELIESVAHARDPISAEFRELLPVHRASFLGMLDNLQRKDWTGLENLWQGVLTTLPHLIALSKGIARRMARQNTASRRITCLRCSATNDPDRRVCSSCGANLPAVIGRAQSVAELGHDAPPAGGVEAMASMSAIDLLEELVRGVEANRVSRRQTGEAIQALLEDIDKVRKTFGAKVIPLIGQDPTLDLYLRFFAQAMGAYTGTLKGMQEFAEGASLAQLHSRLAECRDMVIILEELKARIDEALRG